MVLSIAQKDALKRLEPTILNGLEIDFFSFLSQGRSSYKTNVKKEKLFHDFIDYLIETGGLEVSKNGKLSKAKQKNLFAVFEKIIKKLHNVFWLIHEEIIIFSVEANDKEFKNFYDTLKHIRKSDERIVRWIILYLFYKGKNEIKISDIKKYSKLLTKSQLDKNIQKIVNDKWSSVDILTTSLHLTINHRQDDAKIERFLLNNLELLSKRRAGEIEENILALLDHEALSQKQLSKILDASAPQLSPILKNLRKAKEIRFASDGKQGERFFITNCDNCFRNMEKEKCRSDAIENISKIFKQSLNMDIDKNMLDQTFIENQSLLKLEQLMDDNSRGRDTIIYPNFQKGLQNLFISTYAEFMKNNNPKGVLIRLDDLFEKLGDSFAPGFQLGQQEGLVLYEKILENVGIDFNAKQIEKIRDEFMRIRDGLG